MISYAYSEIDHLYIRVTNDYVLIPLFKYWSECITTTPKQQNRSDRILLEGVIRAGSSDDLCSCRADLHPLTQRATPTQLSHFSHTGHILLPKKP